MSYPILSCVLSCPRIYHTICLILSFVLFRPVLTGHVLCPVLSTVIYHCPAKYVLGSALRCVLLSFLFCTLPGSVSCHLYCPISICSPSCLVLSCPIMSCHVLYPVLYCYLTGPEICSVLSHVKCWPRQRDYKPPYSTAPLKNTSLKLTLKLTLFLTLRTNPNIYIFFPKKVLTLTITLVKVKKGKALAYLKWPWNLAVNHRNCPM